MESSISFMDQDCRVCLKEQAERDIFDIHSPSSLEYASILKSCITLQIQKGDGLPKNICTKCLKLLISFYRFKIIAIENDFKLRKALESKRQKEREENQTTIFTIQSIQNVNIVDENLEPVVSDNVPLEGQTFQLVSAVIIGDNIEPQEKPEVNKVVSADDILFVTDSDSSDSEPEKNVTGDNDEDGNTSFKCDICNETLSSKSLLNQHRKLHIKKTPFSCNICHKRFSKAERVLIHKRIHTGERPHKCLICKKTFIQYATLKHHLRTHTGEKPHMCTLCGKSFSQSGTLANHSRIHTGETPYLCKVCGKSFRNSGNLNTHMRFHTKERPYICQQCDKSFVTSSHLRVHQKSHTGEKPYVCVICHKGFARSEYLKCHLVIHSGKKPYQCNLCPRKYTQSSHLRRHVKTMHEKRIEEENEILAENPFEEFKDIWDMFKDQEKKEIRRKPGVAQFWLSYEENSVRKIKNGA